MHPSTTLGPLGLPVAFRIRDLVVDPAVVLAPMEGVTDLPFRRMVRAIGGTGLTWTEFIPSEGLARGEERWLRMADLDPEERPIAIQVYGRRPQVLAEAARFVQDQGATLVDINMGCPSKKVCAHSGGSALMREPALVAEIVRAVRAAVTVPLSVKMRSGFDPGQRNAPELAFICQEEGAEAITIHWRTRADGYGGERAVDKIAEAVDRLSVPVIGNGDVVDRASAQAMLRQTGCDGLMIGRGALRNPWIFRELGAWLRGEATAVVGPADRLAVLEHYVAECRGVFGGPGAHRSPERATLGRLKQLAKHFLDAVPEGDAVRARVLHSATVDEALEHVQGFFRDPRPVDSPSRGFLPSGSPLLEGPVLAPEPTCAAPTHRPSSTSTASRIRASER